MENKKVTMKEKVLQYVETQGTASFTEIQKFIVDEKFGTGTYAAGYKMVKEWVWNNETKQSETKMVKRNTNRGYYCGAFSKGYYSRTQGEWQSGGYFLRGSSRLVKNENGKYSVIRESK
jgi:hypothetical protein